VVVEDVAEAIAAAGGCREQYRRECRVEIGRRNIRIMQLKDCAHRETNYEYTSTVIWRARVCEDRIIGPNKKRKR
jgi:hypothetical protein